jgi:hypothetical protein
MQALVVIFTVRVRMLVSLICNSELGSVSSSPALCIFWLVKVLETIDSVLAVCNLLETIISLFTHIRDQMLWYPHSRYGRLVSVYL